MHTFVSKLQADFLKNSAFSCFKFWQCNFPNNIAGNKEIRDPIPDANFLMLGDGPLKRLLILSMVCPDLSLFMEIVILLEFITKPRNSSS